MVSLPLLEIALKGNPALTQSAEVGSQELSRVAPELQADPPNVSDQTTKYWSTHGATMNQRRSHWEAHPVVQEVTNERRGGLGLGQWIAHQLPRKATRAAGLGVGAGNAELALMSTGMVDTFDLFDITVDLLAQAATQAQQLNMASRVHCHVADVNWLELPPNSYDLITFCSSLHHVANLELVLHRCREALRSGGVFFAHEYIGPDRFAFPDDHVHLARSVYRTLDPKLRGPLPVLPVPRPLDVMVTDPSESIRSSEIPGLIQKYFPEAQVVSSDVALTIILWYGLNHDAMHDTADGHELARWLLDVDEALVCSGRLPTYQAAFIATKNA